MDEKTIRYYNENASSFTASTRDVAFNTIQDRFLSELKPDALILDLGCGSGRDTKYFLDHHHPVEAMDGSEAMARAASAYTGVDVKHMYFNELNEKNRYDAIWACSSLLHVPKKGLPDILQKCANALKKNGLFYLSFKYGGFEGYRNNRYFTDLTEQSLTELLKQVSSLILCESWISSDVRPGRENEKWLNAFLHRV